MSLTEHRSSPSTVQFIYSLQPRASTSLPNVPSIIDFITSLVQSTLILLFAQLSTNHFRNNRIISPILRYLRYLLPYNDIRILKVSFNHWKITPMGIIGIICLAIFLFFNKRTPIGKHGLDFLTLEESFLIIRGLGVQTTTRMRFPLASHSRFIPASQIDDVFLYEGIKGMQVRYYLAIVVRGEEKVEVVFPVICLSSELISRNFFHVEKYWSMYGVVQKRCCLKLIPRSRLMDMTSRMAVLLLICTRDLQILERC